MVPRLAATCNARSQHRAGADASKNRGKFNTALGIEAQGFCVIR